MRAFWNYFFTINAVNLPVSVLLALISDIIWLPVSFCSFGLVIGLMAYRFFYKNQYYFYYNLGYTRKRLAIIVFGINALIAVPIIIIIISCINA